MQIFNGQVLTNVYAHEIETLIELQNISITLESSPVLASSQAPSFL